MGEPAAAESTDSDRDEIIGRDRWDLAYETGKAPWNVPFPQPAIVDAFTSGWIQSPVVDLGCGSGEIALFLQTKGLQVTGLDLAPTAIRFAIEKGVEKGLGVDFRVCDLLNDPLPKSSFSTAIDSGVFHMFPSDIRKSYVARVHTLLSPNSRLILLAFSDLEPGTYGPHRITRDELLDTFTGSWKVDSLERIRFSVLSEGHGQKFSAGGAHAWRLVARNL